MGRVDTAWKSVGGYLYDSIESVTDKHNPSGHRHGAAAAGRAHGIVVR